ncbi:hypothetical protein [Aquiflexum sp.]|uniref:hypothetical protein n=1 Tax=Aquiflexum sp. TaxID=1872584 RepID=UPI0035930D6B
MEKVKIYPFVLAGTVFQGIIKQEKHSERADSFSNIVSPTLVTGIRIQQIPDIKNFSIDFGVGLNYGKTSVDSRFETGEDIVYGTEVFKELTVLVPLYFNYSFVNLGTSEVYVGLGGIFSSTRQKIDFSIMDYSLKNDFFTLLIFDGFVERKNQALNPAFKAGAQWKKGKRRTFVTEFQGFFQSNLYTINLINDTSKYNQFSALFLLGYRF